MKNSLQGGITKLTEEGRQQIKTIYNFFEMLYTLNKDKERLHN